MATLAQSAGPASKRHATVGFSSARTDARVRLAAAKLREGTRRACSGSPGSLAEPEEPESSQPHGYAAERGLPAGSPLLNSPHPDADPPSGKSKDRRSFAGHTGFFTVRRWASARASASTGTPLDPMPRRRYRQRIRGRAVRQVSGILFSSVGAAARRPGSGTSALSSRPRGILAHRAAHFRHQIAGAHHEPAAAFRAARC